MVPSMERNLSDRIRERAYEIWLSGGCRDGEAEQHWLAAEQEVLAEPSFAEAAAQPPPKDVKGRVGRMVHKRPRRGQIDSVGTNSLREAGAPPGRA
jgi:hypothetical protein